MFIWGTAFKIVFAVNDPAIGGKMHENTMCIYEGRYKQGCYVSKKGFA